MKKSIFTRLVAGAATLALTLSITSALTVDMSAGNEPSFDGVATITVIVTDGTDFTVATGDPIATWSVRTSAGTLIADDTSASATVTGGASTFSITDAVNFPALATADTYSVSFVTLAGLQGAGILSTGGANQVTVTARVEPILAFALNANTLDLGALNVATFPNDATGGLTYDLTTNATGGATVDMESIGLDDGPLVTDTEIGLNDIATAANAAGSYYKVSTAAAPAFVAAPSGVIASGAGADIAATQQIANTGGPVNVVAQPVWIEAVAAGAGQAIYGDVLTFIAAATF